MSSKINHQVSVLIPVYNRSEYIEDCLQSIFIQTHRDFKVIVYDDGSTDDTVARVREFKRNLPLVEKTKLQLLEGDENKGVGFARNTLLSHIDTPFTCWQDSDDLMKENRIEYQLEYLLRHDLEIVYCFMEKINITGESIGAITIDVEKYSDDMQSLNGNVTCPTGFFVSDLKRYPVACELTLGGEDIIWLYQLIRDSRRIGCCDRLLYRYRYHPDRIGQIKRNDSNIEIKLRERNIAKQLIRKIDSIGMA